ncbi:Fatty acid synthase [Araneus ventricosus]|uniref:oleoyl-[acyl-carrier-protein] hydrolase n=1 Tax=Araneus ventricosus TaxID=182803 RepID=A0A4Y2GJY2_ARAVE|nr:Fatty acid synthase [Araneus ventricosus]
MKILRCFFSFLLMELIFPDIKDMSTINAETSLGELVTIEGTVVMLNSLAQLINFPVYGIQCTLEAPSQSIEELAAWYWKHIKSLNISNTIGLAGYSYGGAIAFEMCLQAERDPQLHAEVRDLIMLDGSPAFLSAYTRDHKLYFQSDSLANEEAQALCSYVLQFVDINMMEFKKELKNLPSLANRVKKSVEEISCKYKNLQPEDLTFSFDLYYKRVLIPLKYMPRHKLKKEVTLIKAADSVDMTKNISETYDLEEASWTAYFKFSLLTFL